MSPSSPPALETIARERPRRRLVGLRAGLFLGHPEVLALLPFLLLVWFVARFSVNVPITDQWGLPYLFYALKTGKAGIENFWVANNEHHVFFPKLIWTALAFATSWNTRYEMAISVVLSAITFVALWKVSEAQSEYGSTLVRGLAIFATSALLFSLAQYENWLWGFQLAFILVQACVALTIMLLARKSANSWGSWALAAACCLIASFSSAQGLLAWVVLAPMLLMLAPAHGRNVKVVAWLGLFIAAGLIYRIGYRAHAVVGVSPDRWYAMEHPSHELLFFLALIGAPLAEGRGTYVTEVAGFLALGLFTGLLWFCLSRPSLRKASMPWISLGLFTLGFAAITTVARAGWTVGVAATLSRYTTPDVFIAIAVVQLGRLASSRSFSFSVSCPSCGHESDAELVSGSRIFTAAFVMLLLALGLSSAYSIQQAKSLKREREQGRAVLPLLSYIDPHTDGSIQSPFFGLFPLEGRTGSVRRPGNLLDQIGFRKFARNVAFVDGSNFIEGSFDWSASTTIADGTNEITVSGWAAYVGRRKRPQVVLISHDDQIVFIAAAMVGIKRPDVANVLHDNRYLHTGWRTSFPASFLPAGDDTLKAWVFDAERNQFVKLSDVGGKHHVVVH